MLLFQLQRQGAAVANIELEPGTNKWPARKMHQDIDDESDSEDANGALVSKSKSVIVFNGERHIAELA